uniref:Dihydrofolate reductase n=1 Tax=Sus scrofa TaxID=9823 RepID=A0A8D1V131_PIG
MVRPLNCIVAVSQNMGIGKNGDLPWPPLRNEYKYFQRMTTTSSVEGKQNLVIMGRKTWFSIPEKNRPLKDRINIVLSRELKEPPQGAHFLAKSLDDALKLTEQPELKNKVDMVWIVGGSSVYKVSKGKEIGYPLFSVSLPFELFFVVVVVVVVLSFCLLLLLFLGPLPWHMEVPRPGVESEL